MTRNELCYHVSPPCAGKTSSDATTAQEEPGSPARPPATFSRHESKRIGTLVAAYLKAINQLRVCRIPWLRGLRLCLTCLETGFESVARSLGRRSRRGRFRLVYRRADSALARDLHRGDDLASAWLCLRWRQRWCR